MNADHVQLQEVVVRPLFEVTASEMIYNITADPDRETSDMLSMFDKIPIIEIMPNGKIIVEDENKTFIILRNGRPDALLNQEAMPYEDVMRKLPAMGFTKIKVINNPPLKYKGYDYVIDIETDASMRLVGAVGRFKSEYDFKQQVCG